ncbi:MAG: hypothetical protein ACRENE_20270 [Polyangiaceae bacterium]
MSDGEAPSSRYRVVHDFAVRLINGEIIHLTDEHGRCWRATCHALLWVLDSGACEPVIEGDAFDVAAGLHGLVSRRDVGAWKIADRV